MISFTNSFVNGLVTGPIESILIRSQTLSNSAQKEYSSLTQALRHLKANNELSNLLKGNFGFSLFKGFGTMLYSFWSFVFFFPNQNFSGCMVGIGSACASLSLMYPIEFLRIQMQNKALSDKTITYAKIYTETVKNNGFSGLYYGFGIYCVHRLAI